MGIFIVGLIIVVVCIFPVMFTAKKVDAGKSGLVDVIIAVVVGSINSSIFVALIPGTTSSAFLATVFSLGVTGIIYKFLLDTNYIKGFIIALVPALIYFILDIVFI